jgi:hypothetical protein
MGSQGERFTELSHLAERCVLVDGHARRTVPCSMWRTKGENVTLLPWFFAAEGPDRNV